MSNDPMKDNESVYCACGAQWHGGWVQKAAVNIAAHQQRWRAHHARCWSVPHDWYRRRFTCHCLACAAARAEQRAEKAKARLKRAAGVPREAPPR